MICAFTSKMLSKDGPLASAYRDNSFRSRRMDATQGSAARSVPSRIFRKLI